MSHTFAIPRAPKKCPWCHSLQNMLARSSLGFQRIFHVANLFISSKIAPVWDLLGTWLTSSPTFTLSWCYIISLLAAHSVAKCSEQNEKFIAFSKSLSLSCVYESMIQLLNAQEREREWGNGCEIVSEWPQET